METTLIERIALDKQFQDACQRYAHGNGSSHAIAAAAMQVVAAPDLLEALRVAYSDIQRCPGHTIDMLGRIEATIAKATGE
ncbi:hypothetical protein NUK34_08000 [Kerstersia gyiorum]|uniref:hypothetical protein n=1 Tax=Kerstersia gyiorum TaxID=206506 RepID=UPI0021504C6B|nr:hypothetical protein [Kerstersia gyiorum]MCR4158793.1 hypothetical protein [Kerstersia gyiorum]